MPKCSVKKCLNNTLSVLKEDGVSYFRFPGNHTDREKWRRIVAQERREDFFKPNKSSVICSDHFMETDMYHTKKNYRKLKKHAFPNKGVDNESQSNCINDYTFTIGESSSIMANHLERSSEELKPIESETKRIISKIEEKCTEELVNESEEAYENLFLSGKSAGISNINKLKGKAYKRSLIGTEKRTSSLDTERTREIPIKSEFNESTIFSNAKTIKKIEEFDEYDYFAFMIASKIRNIKNMDDREILMNSIHNVILEYYMKNKKRNLQVQSTIQVKSTSHCGQSSNSSIDESHLDNIEPNITKDSSEQTYIIKVEDDIDFMEEPLPY